MLDDYKSIPFIAGVSLLLVVPIWIGAYTYSSLTNNDENQSAGQTEDSPTESDPFTELTRDSNLPTTPIPPSESYGGGQGNSDADTGIPIGKYSNPPTTIETGDGSSMSGSSITRPDDHFASSIERNRSIQETIGNSSPDYSTPAASNSYNYNDTQDNSLVESLEDDNLLESSEDDNENEFVPLSPATEPLFNP